MSDLTNFQKLYSLNVNDKTEKKKSGSMTLTYLSWSYAWAEFVKVYPFAKYEIVKNQNGLPYFADECGAIVYTKVTVDDLTHEMFLPVMNGANKAMKKESYEYTVKGYQGKQEQTKTVEAFSMCDINKTLMRCLAKNIAMFGLGLYIYAGEDLPEYIPEYISENQKEELEELLIKTKSDIPAFMEYCKVSKLSDIEISNYVAILNIVKSKLDIKDE